MGNATATSAPRAGPHSSSVSDMTAPTGLSSHLARSSGFESLPIVGSGPRNLGGGTSRSERRPTGVHSARGSKSQAARKAIRIPDLSFYKVARKRPRGFR
jgi:hypothetical protein